MTLDEAIAHAKEVAEENYLQGMLCHANPNDSELDRCIDCAREHEQLAEWLEELKKLRENHCGYNETIDVFTNDLKKQIIRCICGGCDTDCKYYDKTVNACEHEALARKVDNAYISEWIPYTEENKPKKEGYYLITVELVVFGEAELVVKKEWFSEKFGCFSGHNIAPLAWMPLPEPYKEKDND